MNWKELYKQKLTTADKAIQAIRNKDRVVFAHAAGVPREIPRALLAHADRYHDVEIYHMLCLGEGEYTQKEMEGHFRHNTNFVGANTRQAVEEDRADFIPCFFHELPTFFRNGTLPVDVAVVHLSSPNEEGYCSFGVSSDYTKPAAEAARIIIAEINEQMPVVGGDNFIHVSELDHIVETSLPLFELPLPKIGEVEKAIGQHCASLIEDGSTLQLGIGAIPDAVLQCLKNKKDLGIHTEMFSDGVVDLVKEGVINGHCKTLHPGKLVATFLMGSKRLYDFVNKNPDVELYPVDYVNDPRIISQNHRLVSINSCIEVDLSGQVCSECIGSKQFSGIGGQVDYVRGAAMSKEGISIMAMPSTAAKGKVSRIVPFLSPGAAVSTSRNDVDYVITEYGIAHLKGKTLRQRAESLIRIAHPDFRESLTEEFFRRFPCVSKNL
ncbi:acetyl-CoA hydrolase/transferase family protein [Sanguibacteroides justesenii]|uniref:4-hydroxybutyrate CoA-transferase n=1 Tax=Sanguibacteroides justesenii TaxID=1547597 RepID=A0AB34R4G7_9PORP|nr:acetyl-CoA hydrolase/transferase C-terminal domain-containing protein [Sanguibacteroides justesenii]KIO45432.1 4-hydroxybutyrate CoA-transferase [Sanguibacteroides justesenii]